MAAILDINEGENTTINEHYGPLRSLVTFSSFASACSCASSTKMVEPFIVHNQNPWKHMQGMLITLDARMLQLHYGGPPVRAVNRESYGRGMLAVMHHESVHNFRDWARELKGTSISHPKQAFGSVIPTVPGPWRAALESLKYRVTQITESITALQFLVDANGAPAMPPWPDSLARNNLLHHTTAKKPPHDAIKEEDAPVRSIVAVIKSETPEGLPAIPGVEGCDKVVQECLEVKRAHDSRVERAIKAVALLRARYGWRARVEAGDKEQEPDEGRGGAPELDSELDGEGDVVMDSGLQGPQVSSVQ
ncbi:hypothetical protein JB92DRAFT_2831606 [Gautieria morchelliformis]|nr:hypothetical protein JB92DRAFT_2831606 [Gautieria morchelliformis]